MSLEYCYFVLNLPRCSSRSQERAASLFSVFESLVRQIPGHLSLQLRLFVFFIRQQPLLCDLGIRRAQAGFSRTQIVAPVQEVS